LQGADSQLGMVRNWNGYRAIVEHFLHNHMTASPANFGKAVLGQDLTDLFP